MVQVPAPPSPTSQERLLGTLIVIVLRAKNLPNRVRIGKQNPYCTITYGLHKKRTDTIERGGQQPEWDAEFRFEILKDGFGGEEQLAAEQAAVVTSKGGVLPAPAMAPSTSQGSDVSSTSKLEKRTSKHSLATPVISTCNAGRRVLKVACWADDARDPKLIGEGELDIEETIRKGKYDDWVQLERKARYAGEVYLELTWYSNEPRKATAQQRRGSHRSPSRAGGAYGGAGSRVDNRSSSDTGTEEWEADAPSYVPQATVAKAQAHPKLASAPTELAADYPDPDVAPLTSSVSTMSLARPPLPVPPAGQPQAPPLSAHSAASFASFQSPHQGPPPEQSQYAYGAYAYDGRRMSQPANGNSTYPQTGPLPPPASVMQQQPYQQYPGLATSEFGHYAPPPQQQQPLAGPAPEFYATHPAPHPTPSPYPQYSSAPPLPNPYAQATPYATLPSHSPYPAPPVPPIPPSGSAYWQHPPPPPPNQLQQAGQGGIPSAPSYHTLPHSLSQPTLFSPPPPPPSLSATQYGQPAYAGSNGVFSPPPPPPSLRHETPSYAHLSSPLPPPPHDLYAYHAQPVVAPPVPPASAASSSSRPPLPQPPTAPSAQQYQSGAPYGSSHHPHA